jgi:hypothetical protein
MCLQIVLTNHAAQSTRSFACTDRRVLHPSTFRNLTKPRIDNRRIEHRIVLDRMSGVPLRAILLSELTSVPGFSQPLSQRRFAYYSKTPVLVDPKTYGETPDDPLGERVYNRVADLTTTLGSLRSDDYLTLQCIGYLEKDMQFCFLYSLPVGCEPPPTPIPPQSLLDLVTSSFKPSVTARIQLAYRLAYSISKIHNEGWLHKGIRSENVLFFPSRWGAPRSLDSPRLVGFDFARKDGPEEYSEKPVLVSIIFIFYLHPLRSSDTC